MSKSILVVDDEAAVTLSLEGFFRHKGYEVLKAFYGDQALQQIEQKRPAVVILDLQMPGLNGVEVLKKIRTDYPEIKTLVITGFSDQYREQLDQLKAEKVWTKPVSLMELTRAVDSMLEGSPDGERSAAGPGAPGRPRLLFVEGSQEVYEQALKPYFEAEERGVRCQTAAARDPDEALRLAQEFKPHLIVVDSTRLPVGVEGGRLAARLTGGRETPVEVILVEFPSKEFQFGEIPVERLKKLEEAVRRAAGKHAAQ